MCKCTHAAHEQSLCARTRGGSCTQQDGTVEHRLLLATQPNAHTQEQEFASKREATGALVSLLAHHEVPDVGIAHARQLQITEQSCQTMQVQLPCP